jgi:hypothetical protein
MRLLHYILAALLLAAVAARGEQIPSSNGTPPAAASPAPSR